MSSIMIFQTIMECAAVGFIIWGLFNEEKLASAEKRLLARIRRRKLRIYQSTDSCKKHCA